MISSNGMVRTIFHYYCNIVKCLKKDKTLEVLTCWLKRKSCGKINQSNLANLQTSKLDNPTSLLPPQIGLFSSLKPPNKQYKQMLGSLLKKDVRYTFDEMTRSKSRHIPVYDHLCQIFEKQHKFKM